MHYKNNMKNWSEKNNLPLEASYGCVWGREYADEGITAIARHADERMYKAKAEYYQMRGNDRRKKESE